MTAANINRLATRAAIRAASRQAGGSPLRRAGALATILQIMLLSAAAAAPAAPDDEAAAVAARMRQTFPGMPADARIEPTVVPGIYAMRVPGFKGCPVYTDAAVSMVANNGQRGWVGLPGGRPLDEARSRTLMSAVYRALPAGLVDTGGGGAGGMVLISGVDCQPSARMEDALAAQRVSYRILPAALDEAHLGSARAAVCARERSKAWQALRRSGARPAVDPACTIDAAALKDLSCMVMGGRLPSAPLPDGRFSRQPSEIEALAQH